MSESTLRRWEREKRLLSDKRTKGGQRRYRTHLTSEKIMILNSNRDAESQSWITTLSVERSDQMNCKTGVQKCLFYNLNFI
jgi:hypothetical protein